MNIIHKNCERKLSKNRELPINSYLVTYIFEGKESYDIVQSSGRVEVFDYYYDNYGKGNILNIEWTDGRINPKMYGYVPKETKKKR
jgi:hypothetical protein